MIEVRIVVDGEEHDVKMEERGGAWVAEVDGHAFPVRWDQDGTRAVVSAGPAVFEVDTRDPRAARIDGQHVPFCITSLAGVEGAPADAAGTLGPITPPMTGRLEALLVKEGQQVAEGDVLFVLEAMKMRNEVKAPAAAVVKAVRAAEGDAVDTGTVILELAAAEE